MKETRFCVIMCGGIGSRFWPFSREKSPKQFLDFLGTGRTLLQMSYDRILPIIPKENIIIVTSHHYLELVKKQLPELPIGNILLEPTRRNTAPCIVWAAMHINAINPDSSMIVMPSDHLIVDTHGFECSVLTGFEFVENNSALLTLGIEPTRPDTGYGYIKMGDTVSHKIKKVERFTEKPSKCVAESFLSEGDYVWNAGIFVWKTKNILNSIAEYAPGINSVMGKGVSEFGTNGEVPFIEQNFSKCPSESIDVAVIEKADNVFVEPVSFGWSDLGTWTSLFENLNKDEWNNASRNCETITIDSENNLIASPNKKLVVLSDMKDYIIANTDDVLMICPKSKEQQVKEIVNQVKEKYGNKYI